MANIQFRGKSVQLEGNILEVGDICPDFLLTTSDLRDINLGRLGQGIKILNIVPSLDTGVCATSAKEFDELSRDIHGAQIFTISYDLPFAQNRFFQMENIRNQTLLSCMRDREFGKRMGLEIGDGPLRGLLARCVLVLDKDNRLVYRDLVEDISHEPDYQMCISMVQSLNGKA